MRRAGICYAPPEEPPLEGGNGELPEDGSTVPAGRDGFRRGEGTYNVGSMNRAPAAPLDPMISSRSARLPRGACVALFLEVVAFGTLLVGSCSSASMLSRAARNEAPLGFRLLSLAMPLTSAACALLGGVLWVRVRPDRVLALQCWIRRAAPLLALWPGPMLLRQEAFAERPVFVLIAAGAAALGLERSLRYAAPSYRGFTAGPTWRMLVTSRSLPRLMAAFSIAAVLVFLCLGSLRLHARFLTSNYDLGLFENLFWNTLHGRHGHALGQQYFAQHAEFLIYLLLPLYAALPRAETLLVLQAGLLAGAAIPLYLVAERWLCSGWAALVFVLAYLSHPALHGPAFYDFHFLSLSAFFLLWATYFHVRRVGSIAFWSALLLALCCREDVAIGVAAVGAGLAWNAGRARHDINRVGLTMCALGAAWFLLVKFVWMRQFGPTTFSGYYSELVSDPTRGFGGLLLTLVSNPLYAFSRLLSEQKLLLALQLLVPLAFLPLRYPRAWFLLVPGLLVVGLADSASAIVSVYFHYATHFLPHVFVAALFALAVRSRRSHTPVVLAVAFASLISCVHFSAFSPTGPTDPFPHVSFHWSEEDTAHQDAFRRLAAQIPSDASVSAGEYEGAQLARRETLLALKFGTESADYVIYSLRSLGWGGRAEVQHALEEGEYGVLDMASDLALLARDHATSRNSEALGQLR